ncbi:MAG: ABC transporter permease [Acidimicrobiales bacterium]
MNLPSSARRPPSPTSATAASGRAQQRARRRANARRARRRTDATIVSIYEPDVRYVPPVVPYLRSLWERRSFMVALAETKVRSSRADTALGPIWALLDPMFQVAIYYFLFTVIRGGSKPNQFLPILIFGILHSQMASAALTEGGQSVTSGRQLMLNSAFPRALLPISTIISGWLRFLPAIPVLAVSLVVFRAIHWTLFWWPVLLAIQVMIGLGLALVASTLVVFFRDMRNVLTYINRIMFFTAPIIYVAADAPASIVRFLRWGPLFGVFANYQRIVTGQQPDPKLLALAVFWGIAGVVFGGWIFLRHEREFGSKM